MLYKVTYFILYIHMISVILTIFLLTRTFVRAIVNMLGFGAAVESL